MIWTRGMFFLNVSFTDAVDDVLIAVSIAMSNLCT